MKKLIRTQVAIVMAIAFFIMYSCDDDPLENPDESLIVYIEDDITEITTWYSDSIYVIKAWNFYVENTLTIQAGTIIKFHPDGPDMTLGSGGTIIASGTSDEPIIFTSWKDDAFGGDTNGDNSGSQPAVLDWGEISTNGENGSVFEYCQFYYGGDSYYNATLTIDGNGVIVDHCLFVNNSGNNGTGWYGVLDAVDGGVDTDITHNTFYSNVRPLSIGTAFSIDNTNIFHDPDNTDVTNDYNGILVETIYEVTGVIAWDENEVPFVIDDNDWWIESGAVLNLANNVVLKFKTGSAISLKDGTSNIPNYNGTGVVFTSYKDDNYGGDTNGDGTSTSPVNGDWYGIYDNFGSSFVNWTNIYFSSYN